MTSLSLTMAFSGHVLAPQGRCGRSGPRSTTPPQSNIRNRIPVEERKRALQRGSSQAESLELGMVAGLRKADE
eukprot:1979007-Rhodomonas_salina.3